jgi:hypothetical protein
LPENQIRLMEGLIPKLEHNQGRIGTKPLSLDNLSLTPTIENWLKDYNNAPNSGALRTDIDALNYVNKSANPNQLTPEERKQLMTLIRLYDASRNLLQAYNSLPEAKTEQEYFESLDKYRRRRFATQTEGEDEVTQSANAQEVTSPPLPPNRQVPGSNNSNLQDLLNPETQTDEQLAIAKRKSGVFVAPPAKNPLPGQNKPITLPPVLEKVAAEPQPTASSGAPKSAQVDIDKKLAELRSRAGIK